MKTTTTREDFLNTLKHGKSYVSVKKQIDNLCKTITDELNGTYYIEYNKKKSVFMVNVYVSKWINKPTFDANDSSFRSAYSFASTELFAAKNLLWYVFSCSGNGHVQYRILHL